MADSVAVTGSKARHSPMNHPEHDQVRYWRKKDAGYSPVVGREACLDGVTVRLSGKCRVI